MKLPLGQPWPEGLPRTTPARMVPPEEADPDPLAHLQTQPSLPMNSFDERQAQLRQQNENLLAAHTNSVQALPQYSPLKITD
ncbi:MAG: hypothetical protein RIK87_17305 [Fuerstiella sp.]